MSHAGLAEGRTGLTPHRPGKERIVKLNVEEIVKAVAEATVPTVFHKP